VAVVHSKDLTSKDIPQCPQPTVYKNDVSSFFWGVPDADPFCRSVVNLKPLILVKAINSMAEINDFLRISILYLKSSFIGKVWTGVVGEDQVAAAKTALQGAIENFDQGVRQEADFIIWEREDA
jgi:hypothetical protein